MHDHPQLSVTKFHQLSDGKRLRYALFEPQKARATILIAAGRREFLEKKYAEMGEEFLSRHFRVIIFEWRGQGLSDRLLTGPKKQRDHIHDFVSHLDDLGSFYEAVVKTCRTGPLFVTGHSMGGHLLLRWLVERQPPSIAGVILTAPMLALASLPVHTIARAMTWTSIRLGYGSDYAPAQHDYNASDRDFDHNPLSHDQKRFAIMEKYFDAFPDLTVGGVTWAWLDAAFISMHHIQHRHYFDGLNTPVLNIMGGSDQVTPSNELVRITKRINNIQNIIIDGAYHDILSEADHYRLKAWEQIDLFIKSILPAEK